MMDGLFVTAHASARMHQRGIQRAVVEAIFANGRAEHSHGAHIYFIDRRARDFVRDEVGAKEFAQLEKNLSTYLVIGDDGRLVTAARRTRRFRR